MPNRDVLRPWMGIDRSAPEVCFVTEGMAMVGTLDGVISTFVSSPGASSGGWLVAYPDAAVEEKMPGRSSLTGART
ncbi:hypothetical protein [Tessaracoccus antarcticus]|uniref:hypothetical protein n=1 Tax=Tessaracoccus antarcticus TaxID=2479848 RepID=UPI001F28B32E|nr:hypothetical protein [Tessaracoccus antarcticus]